MPPRKFYYADTVQIDSGRYDDHQKHLAMVASTRINTKDGRWPRVVYEVACECGTTLRPEASSMHLIERPSLPIKQNIRAWQARVFVETVNRTKEGPPPPYDYITAARELISGLSEKEKYILVHRYGLEGASGETYTEIGGMLDLSGERIRQIEQAVMIKLRRPL
jgi:hypothetical protein